MGKKDEGILLVVSGPSGAGKGTICNEIRNIYPELNYSISMTTRTARVGEEEGVSYFFRSKEEFDKRRGLFGVCMCIRQLLRNTKEKCS